MRSLFVVLHRWLGLGLAAFLFVSGLTGATIAWEDELDAWLNPDLFRHTHEQPTQPVLDLVERVESADPRLRVDYTPLSIAPGHTLYVRIRPRVDPSTGEAFPLPFDHMAIDPVTGAVLGTRRWGSFSLARRDLLPFLYELHSSLHLPSAGSIDTGTVVMGLVALVWSIDCFVALWISFPSRKTWRKSFQFRLRAGSLKLLFDLHRSSGVWAWLLLLTLAVTGISLTLRRELMEPVVAAFSQLSESPLEIRATVPEPHRVRVDRAQAIERATVYARRRGITAPAGGVFHVPVKGAYGVGFFRDGEEHPALALGSSWIYVDDQSGAEAGADIPGEGSAGDVFLQAQFPLHSGHILGAPGRALVSALGLIVALLSVTGVIIWARKRRARLRSRRPSPDRPLPSP